MSYGPHYKDDYEWKRRKRIIYILSAIFVIFVVFGFVYHWDSALAEGIYFLVIVILYVDAILITLLKKKEAPGQKKKSLREMFPS